MDALMVAERREKKCKAALKVAKTAYRPARRAMATSENEERLTGGVGNHVALSNVNDGVAKAFKNQVDHQTKELFLSFRAFCMRKNVKCKEIILEDMDVAKGLCDYVKLNLVASLVEREVLTMKIFNNLILGNRKFMATDVPTNVSKGAPEFCSVYVISKGKIVSVRSATIPVPNPPPCPLQNQSNPLPSPTDGLAVQNNNAIEIICIPFRQQIGHHLYLETQLKTKKIKSPFNRYKASNRSYGDLSMSDGDLPFASSDRPSIESMLASSFDSQEFGVGSQVSYSSDTDNRNSIGSLFSESKSSDLAQPAAEKALTAKQKAMELHDWKMEEQQRLEEARRAQEAALAIAEKERAKTKAAIERAEAAQRIAELEAQKRMNAERKALKEEKEKKKKAFDVLAQSDVRYHKYTIEEIEAATDRFSITRKVGEGGYGPVYKCFLDHTPVAIKVLRPDAAQGRSQFQQEIEVLSCIRHPNMVLLLGACPEYGCLVYEYMANGSLDDCLFRRGNTPSLPWQLRFRIAAEIASALLFLHQAKPEPLVHRDLKPANILLDRNFPLELFCYIDPEYQQTGMLGTKSDIYSLGIMLLQVVTAKPPMGLTHQVERAIEKGNFGELLDPSVPDWPVEEALNFAKLALKCAELRRKDRPDLKDDVLPELNRLRSLAEEKMSIGFTVLGGRIPRTSPRLKAKTPQCPKLKFKDISMQQLLKKKNKDEELLGGLVKLTTVLSYCNNMNS
ncbi:kinase with adenine nucleotide alpha hydrolases-like domain-containing protein [Actinidia rufa]|uniref:RING-type E3 ubiquitin transferase n=1 Tax=Actinidia rufa TaxID=165716 RepID=A0A7J0E3R2_9ERIC|nr:kinase with adenine nucleotide alpha hydrolases-like domain-containing protein [Actinidia rufa]